MKQTIIVFLSALLLGSFSGSTFANQGKKMFSDKCLGCHLSPDVKSPVEPIDKASFQWKYFFKRKKHKRKAKVALAKSFKKAELKAIELYLVDHASDSDRPEVIGKR